MAENIYRAGDEIEGVFYAGEVGAHSSKALDLAHSANDTANNAVMSEAGNPSANLPIPSSGGASSTVAVYNTEAIPMPDYSVGEVTSIDASGVRQIRRPASDDIQPAFLVFNGSSTIAARTKGTATQAFDGIGEVRANTMTAGSHCGTTNNAWTLVRDNYGLVALGTSGGGARVMVRPFDYWKHDIDMKIYDEKDGEIYKLTGAYERGIFIREEVGEMWTSEIFTRGWDELPWQLRVVYKPNYTSLPRDRWFVYLFRVNVLIQSPLITAIFANTDGCPVGEALLNGRFYDLRSFWWKGGS